MAPLEQDNAIPVSNKGLNKEKTGDHNIYKGKKASYQTAILPNYLQFGCRIN